MTERNIYELLVDAQNRLNAPKGRYNKFGNYSYRSAEDIMEAAKPINAELGLTLILTDDIEVIADRVYVKATAKLFCKDQTIEVSAYAREAQTKKGMDDAQITGSASSYARKYALNGLYLIDDNKDPDTNEYRTQQQNNAPNKQAKTKQKKQAVNLDNYSEKQIRASLDRNGVAYPEDADERTVRDIAAEVLQKVRDKDTQPV